MLLTGLKESTVSDSFLPLQIVYFQLFYGFLPWLPMSSFHLTRPQTLISSIFLNFFSLHTALDDKGETASETSLRLGPAGQSIWREVWQQPAAAGGRWKGTAPHWPQHGWQELQQEEHLQQTQVKQQMLTHSHHTRTWLGDPSLSHFLGTCGHRRRRNSASLQIGISGLGVRMKTEDGGAV